MMTRARYSQLGFQASKYTRIYNSAAQDVLPFECQRIDWEHAMRRIDKLEFVEFDWDPPNREKLSQIEALIFLTVPVRCWSHISRKIPTEMVKSELSPSAGILGR